MIIRPEMKSSFESVNAQGQRLASEETLDSGEVVTEKVADLSLGKDVFEQGFRKHPIYFFENGLCYIAVSDRSMNLKQAEISHLLVIGRRNRILFTQAQFCFLRIFQISPQSSAKQRSRGSLFTQSADSTRHPN